MKYFRIYLLLLFLSIYACKDAADNDYNPITNNCNNPNYPIEDITGTCCSFSDLDCNSICYLIWTMDFFE